MAVELKESQVKEVLANPAAFYELLTTRKGYVPKAPVCEGDNELVLTDVAALDCLVACVIVHKRREAFLLLLSAEDVAEFRGRLGDGLTSMNMQTFTQAIIRRLRPGLLNINHSPKRRRKTMSEARERLKQSAASVATITTQIEQLETAATSSARIVEIAQAQIEGFKGLHREIAKFRVGMVKAGLGTQSLPASLKAKMKAKRGAEEELEQSISTRDMIDSELKAARGTIQAAQEAANLAAVNVLREIADVAAAELITINARQWELAWVLQGLEYLNFPSSRGVIRTGRTPLMGQAMVRRDPEFVGVFDPLADMVLRWKKRLDILLADPDADLSLPKPVVPQDYELIPVVHPNDGVFRMPQGRFVTRPEA